MARNIATRTTARVAANYMDIRGLAEMLGISVPTLYRWRAEGVDLPPAVSVGTRLRWRLETVEAWATAREALSTDRTS